MIDSFNDLDLSKTIIDGIVTDDEDEIPVQEKDESSLLPADVQDQSQSQQLEDDSLGLENMTSKGNTLQNDR